MQQALQRQDEFNSFVFDDAEICIMNHGTFKDRQDPRSPLLYFDQILNHKQSYLITSSSDNKFYKVLEELYQINVNDNQAYMQIPHLKGDQLEMKAEIFPTADECQKEFQNQVINW